MLCKIVISVLVILAGVMASTGIADMAGWNFNALCSGESSDRFEACIQVTDGQLVVSYHSRPGGVFDSMVGGSWMGFGYLRAPPFNSTWIFFVIFCPFCVPVLFLAAYPTIAFIRGPLRRRRRRRRGLCIRCGYNLQGNESGVCPECGEAR